MKKLIVCLLVYSITLVSCSNGDDLLNGSLNSPTANMSVLAVFNAVPESDQVHVFLNGERLNSNIEIFRYGEFLRHRTVFPGNRTLGINIRYGNRTLSPSSTSLNLMSGKNYSLLLTSENLNESILVEDDLLLPRNGQFKLRFVNTNRSGDKVALMDIPSQKTLFNAIDAGRMSSFITMDLADYQLRIATDQAGRQEQAFDFKPANQGVYTIWLTGSLEKSNQNGLASPYTLIRHP